jgi:HPt (histidine-containing phosphotransfer) domain-containing protein
MTEMNKGDYFDLSYMVSICDGDWQFMKEMIETFLRDSPEIIGSMQTHADKKEWRRVGEYAHKFKTSLMFMGIQSLHGVIREIETNGREGIDTEGISGKIDRVNEICSKAIVELRAFIEKHS